MLLSHTKVLTQGPRIDVSNWARSVISNTSLYLSGQSDKITALHREIILHEYDLAKTIKLISGISGNYGFVFQSESRTIAVSDSCNSHPILIGHDKKEDVYVISPSGSNLARILGLESKDTSTSAALSIALSGYTIGENTLYPAVQFLPPGTLVVLEIGELPKYIQHHRFQPWQPGSGNREALKGDLMDATRHLFERLISSLDGRPVVIPLSGGLDSRLMAAGLKEFGYRDVRCFAYGRSGNHEAKASREISERLGYPWQFVPYTIKRQKSVYNTEDHKEFVNYSDHLSGVHFEQEFLALRDLKDSGWLPEASVVVNGQSGDFISGNHIPTLLIDHHVLERDARIRQIADLLLAKHFKLWRSAVTDKTADIIRKQLAQQLLQNDAISDNPENDFGAYEWSEFLNRQCKYVVQNVRAYEFFGYDWRMPLWDREYMDFWADVPVSEKHGQNLYREVLHQLNWGNVWREIPVNAKTIQPAWLRPIRYGLKVLHAPLGRERWHRFEERYLVYWMDNLCSNALLPYRVSAADFRGHIGAMSWWTKAYLERKGISLEAAAYL
jgi:asparagine synthase (glutamine-hydrolysing)